MSRAATAIWAAALATVLHDERTVPSLAPRDGVAAAVTAIVPARDEERAVADTLRDLVDQCGEVIAVDDESRDGTRAAMAGVPGIVVVDGAPPPPGWLGKPWACRQGADRATGEWLLFSDADIRWAPGAVAALLAFAQEGGRGGATAFPRLVTGTAIERVVLPVAGVLMQTAVIPSWAARSPRTRLAIGVGGALLVERTLYERLGGHGAVRDEVVDDLALARAAKAAGHLLPWARGDRLLSLRYYEGLGGMWEGWRKNASHAWRGPLPVAVAGGAAVQWALLAPWVALARGRPAAVALQLACLARVVRGTDISPVWALAAPAGGLFLAAVGAAAALDRARGRARWRGRPIQSSSPSST